MHADDTAASAYNAAPDLSEIIDPDKFENWLRQKVVLNQADALSFRLLQGGKSNLTILAQNGANKWVLRRPPLGNKIASAHDVSREFIFYEALKNSAIPVPRAIAYSDDETIMGAQFYLMDYVDGEIYETPEDVAPVSLTDRRKLGISLAHTLARIHNWDFAGSKIETISKPSGYLERQVSGWSKQWEKSERGSSDTSKAITDLSDRLKRALPETRKTSIVHGDFRIANCMFHKNRPSEIVAVLDWEMATLGDPLADLGYSLTFWGAKDQPSIESSNSIPDTEGFIDEDAFIQHYVEAGGLSVDSIDYYKVLAWFKLAVLTQGFLDRLTRTRGRAPDHLVDHQRNLALVAMETANRSQTPILNGR